jgi:stearoyl-CoA desaturase (delta-9 desaturase)
VFEIPKESAIHTLSSFWRLRLYHLHLILLHVAALAALYHFDLFYFCGSLAIYVFFQIFAGNIALHRYFSHGSFATGPRREKILILLANSICLGSSISWVSTHKHHHKHADQPEDCHSPHHLSVFRILTGYWNPPQEVAASLRPLKFFSWHLFFHRWYYFLHFSLMAILFLINWKIMAYFYALPNLMIYYALYSVVIICHRFGYRNFPREDRSYNQPLVALITLGEGWHNNHHENPRNHRNSVLSHEWDPTARVIEILFTK